MNIVVGHKEYWKMIRNIRFIISSLNVVAVTEFMKIWSIVFLVTHVALFMIGTMLWPKFFHVSTYLGLIFEMLELQERTFPPFLLCNLKAGLRGKVVLMTRVILRSTLFSALFFHATMVLCWYNSSERPIAVTTNFLCNSFLQVIGLFLRHMFSIFQEKIQKEKRRDPFHIRFYHFVYMKTPKCNLY